MKEYKKCGLIVNTQKTKYLNSGADTEILVMEGNEEVRTCNKYLGITLYREAREQEVNNIITRARRIIAYLDDIS